MCQEGPTYLGVTDMSELPVLGFSFFLHLLARDRNQKLGTSLLQDCGPLIQTEHEGLKSFSGFFPKEVHRVLINANYV